MALPIGLDRLKTLLRRGDTIWCVYRVDHMEEHYDEATFYLLRDDQPEPITIDIAEAFGRRYGVHDEGLEMEDDGDTAYSIVAELGQRLFGDAGALTVDFL